MGWSHPHCAKSQTSRRVGTAYVFPKVFAICTAVTTQRYEAPCHSWPTWMLSLRQSLLGLHAVLLECSSLTSENKESKIN